MVIELIQFNRMSDFFNSDYKFVMESIKDDFIVIQKCLDASKYIAEIIERRAHGCVFFSATLTPVDYYVKLITNGVGKSIKITSPFKQSNLGLFVDGNVSTRYRDRDRSIDHIIDSIGMLSWVAFNENNSAACCLSPTQPPNCASCKPDRSDLEF